MPKRTIPRATSVTDEPTLWTAQSPTAESALDFAIAFLGCRSQGAQLDATARGRLLTIVRAVSWVESRHGTAGANQPGRDPLQCGNPADSWWKALTGQLGDGDRFIRGPGLTNLWAREVAAAAEATASFPTDAAMAKLSDDTVGHDDTGFAPAHSYVWGIIYLIHKINTTAGDKSYDCGDLARDRLIDGAVQYNGGGDPNYRTKIEAALKLIGDLAAIVATADPLDKHLAAAPDLIASIVRASKPGDPSPSVARASVTFDPKTGRIVAVEVHFQA